MTMYGDTDAVLRRAGQLREQGVDIRSLADHLVARTESLGWSGRAAESMRLRIQERAAHLRAAAAQHETAAESLDRHAHEVERVKDEIAEAERRATALVDDGTLVDFTPPPSGHQDWLAVDLPGLRTT